MQELNYTNNMDTQSLLQKVKQNYYTGSDSKTTQPTSIQTSAQNQSFVAPKSQETNLTSKVVNQIQKEPRVKGDILKALDEATSKVMKPVSDFFYGSSGRTIGGLLSAGYGNLLQFSKDEETKERGKRIEERAASQFTPTNIGFTALELIPGGGVLKNMAKEGFEKVGLNVGSKAIDYGAELLSKGGEKMASTVKNSILNVGSRLTSVGKDVLERWGDYAAINPKKLETVKKYVAENADNPMLGLANTVSEGINKLKNEAQTMYTSVKDAVKKQYKDTTFNLGTKLDEVNNTLKDFNLEVRKTKNGIVVQPTTRTSPFTDKQIQNIQNVVNKLDIQDMSIDELTDFVELSRVLKDAAINEAEKSGNKKLIPLTMNLFNDASRFVDEVLPEMKEANDMYRKYYKVMDNFGNKVVDSSGQLKTGGESFLSNALNLNKGEQRKLIEESAKDLGIDILENAEMLKDATKMAQAIPNSVRNRMVDMLIATGLTTAAGTAVGSATGGGEGAGYGAASGIATTGILYALSNPNRYGRIIEWLAKKQASHPPISEIRQLYKDIGMQMTPRLVPDGVSNQQDTTESEFGNFGDYHSQPQETDEWNISF